MTADVFDRAAFAADLIAWAHVRQREAVDDRAAGHTWSPDKIGRTNMLLNAAALICDESAGVAVRFFTTAELDEMRRMASECAPWIQDRLLSIADGTKYA